MLCTLRQCKQCRNILAGGLGTTDHQQFCLKFLQKKWCCKKIKDNSIKRMFWSYLIIKKLHDDKCNRLTFIISMTRQISSIYPPNYFYQWVNHRSLIGPWFENLPKFISSSLIINDYVKNLYHTFFLSKFE